MGVLNKFFRWVQNILWGEKFEIDGKGTDEDVENKNRTVNNTSVNILLCFKFFRSL